MKIKGNKNESYHLRASLSSDLNHVICGSEDGDVYLWSQIESNIVNLSQQQSSMQIISSKVMKQRNKKNKDKSNQLEYWTAFDKSTPVSAAIFAPSNIVKLYQKLNKKIHQNPTVSEPTLQEGNKINMVMVCCSTNGLIKVFKNESNTV